ncbi:MAG TPA: PIN domain nuclease [Zeimonas sp.]
MILVDSSVWIDYFRGAGSRAVEALDRSLGSEPLAIGDLILVEVLQGFDEDRAFDRVRKLLTGLTVITLGGPDIAVRAARNFRLLRRRGITVRKTIDTVIATRCIESGLRLLHSDRNFDPFEKHLGLRTVVAPRQTN